MKKLFAFLFFSLIGTVMVLPVAAQNGLGDESGVRFSAFDTPQESYLKRMAGLLEELKHVNDAAQRKQIARQMRQVSEDYRAANPPKELTPIEIETRSRQVEEMLKQDPFRWEIFQLHQARARAATPEERDSYQERIQALVYKHAAEEESKLTPEQRYVARVRREKNAQMRFELNPLLRQLHGARTVGERGALHAQILVVLEKYQE